MIRMLRHDINMLDDYVEMENDVLADRTIISMIMNLTQLLIKIRNRET